MNEVYSRSYFYSNDLSLYRDSRGVLVSYRWHPNKLTMDQIIANFVDASKILTVDECQKEAVDFLVANSIETKGYRLKSEPVLDEENKTYTFTWVRYVGEDPTLDTYSVIVMQNGFVRSFGGTLINCVPYYEENPINIFEARKAAMALMAEEFIPKISEHDDAKNFEKVVIYFDTESFDGKEYQITHVPGKGIAIVFMCGIEAIDSNVYENPPHDGDWSTWLQYIYVTI